jgi:hypothetical protein
LLTTAGSERVRGAKCRGKASSPKHPPPPYLLQSPQRLPQSPQSLPHSRQTQKRRLYQCPAHSPRTANQCLCQRK